MPKIVIVACEVVFAGDINLDFSEISYDLLVVIPPVICEQVFCSHMNSVSDRAFFTVFYG